MQYLIFPKIYFMQLPFPFLATYLSGEDDGPEHSFVQDIHIYTMFLRTMKKSDGEKSA